MSDNRVRRAWRDATLGGITRLVGGRAQPMPRWDDGTPRRVLFLRHDRIGDMLMSTGIIPALGRAHPRLTLDVLATPANAPALDGIDGVGEVLVHRVRGPREALRVGRLLRPRGYDAVVDGLVLNGRVITRTAALLAGTGAPVRIGMGGARQQAHVYTHPVPPPPDPDRAHHVEWLAQLAAPFGLDPRAVPRPTLAVTADEAARAAAAWRAGRRAPDAGEGAEPVRLVVNVSAGSWHRRWPDGHFAEVLGHLARRHPDVQVALLSEPGERDAVAALAAAGGVDAPATPTLRDALALVAAADGVFTPDTSIAHAAAAFGTPCVSLMLPGTGRFGPYRTPGEVVFSPGPLLPSLDAAAALPALDRLVALARAARGRRAAER